MAMAQQVVAGAEALLTDPDPVGHAVLSGVFFDTDRAGGQPESQVAP